MNTLADWAALDGYGLYVWGSYGLALLAVLGEALALRARLRRALAPPDTDTDTESTQDPER